MSFPSIYLYFSGHSIVALLLSLSIWSRQLSYEAFMTKAVIDGDVSLMVGNEECWPKLYNNCHQ